MTALRPLLFVVFLSFSSAGIAASQDEVRLVFDFFVKSQNAHNLADVGQTLLDSKDFLWVTRGTPIWGRDAALERFSKLYQGTWRLEPDMSALKITMMGDNSARVYVPIVFSIGEAGKPPQQTRFLMTQTLVKSPVGWRISSILPIPEPAQ